MNVISYLKLHKNKLLFVLVSILIMSLIFYLGYSLGSKRIEPLKDTLNSALVQGDVALDFDYNLNDANIPVSISVPEALLCQILNDAIANSEVKGIDDLSINLSSKGLDLGAKYTLLGFIKIPAQFTLVPELDDNENIKLSIKNVKIMNLKIKIDKIIEKWISLNDEIKDFVTYDSGSVYINTANLEIAKIKELSLKEGFVNMKLNIVKDSLK